MAADPTIGAAHVVSDQELGTAGTLDQVQVFGAADLAKNDGAFLEGVLVREWLNCAELTGPNLASHGLAPRPKRYGFPSLEFGDMSAGPSHDHIVARSEASVNLA